MATQRTRSPNCKQLKGGLERGKKGWVQVLKAEEGVLWEKTKQFGGGGGKKNPRGPVGGRRFGAGSRDGNN